MRSSWADTTFMVEGMLSLLLRSDNGRRGARAATVLVCALAFSAAFGVGWAAVPVLTGESAPSASVRDHGAVGDGVTDDTAAVQRANDAVAAQGGGSVVFPGGTYVAMGVRQDSNVHFVGTDGATLRHPDGVSKAPVITGRTTRTTGSIQAGSRTVSVTSTKRMVPGAVVGVQAAGVPSPMQTGTLTSGVSADGGDLVLSSADGWRVKSANYIWVDEEIVGYTGMFGSTLLNVRRGMFGSTPSEHSAGAPVAQVIGLVARIESVGPGRIELDRPAARAVVGAAVTVGVMNPAVTGLTIDGNRVGSGSADSNTVALDYAFARGVRIEDNTIRNVDHGAVTFDQGTADSVIADNVFWDAGSPEQASGSSIWLYRGAFSNTVRDNRFGGAANFAVAIDDRTEVSTDWDGSSDENLILGNTIDIPPVKAQAAIFISGSNRNEVANNDVRSTKRGITVALSTQGSNPGDSEGNNVHDNRFSGHSWGLHASGSYNRFERNVVTLTTKPIVDTGVGNEFVGNVFVDETIATPSPTSQPSPTPDSLTDGTPAPTVGEAPPAAPQPTPTFTPEPTSPPTPTPSPAPAKRRHTPVGHVAPVSPAGGGGRFR